jgi:hypothetical protein
MLTEEDDVLARRGWSVSAIARHTGRERKTVRKYLQSPRATREPAPSCLEPFRDYLVARFVDDAHVDATVLHREVCGLRFERSYVTFARELRRLGLRPRCEACRRLLGLELVEQRAAVDRDLARSLRWSAQAFACPTRGSGDTPIPPARSPSARPVGSRHMTSG